MDLKRRNLIISITGYLGLLNGIQRFLLPIALITNDWNINDYGTIYFIQAFAMAIPLIIGGFSTDLKGRKSTIIISFFLFTIGVTLFAFVITGVSLLSLILAQVITTVSFGISRMALSIQMVDETEEGQERTSSLGLQAAIRNFTGFIGPLTFGIILDNYQLSFLRFTDYQVGFLILSVLGIVGVILSFFLPKTNIILIQKNKEVNLTHLTQDEKTMQYSFGIQEIIIGFTSGLIVPFISYYILTEFSPTNFQWGLLTGVGSISVAIGSALAGFVAEDYGKGKFVLISNITVPIFATGIALGPTLSIVSLFYVARIMMANLIHPIYESWYYMHINENLRGRTMSFIQTGRRLSRAFGTATGPIAFTLLGPLTFPLGCLFYPIAMLIPFVQETRLNDASNSIEN